MRLLNAEPISLIGQTIIYRHQFWRVDQIDNDSLKLSKHCLDASGKLGFHQLRYCRLYLTVEAIRQRYTRLIRLLREVCLLTQGEAESAIQGYIVSGGYFVGSEAVAHIGGALSAIRHALSRRHFAQRAFRARGAPHSFIPVQH